MRTLSIIVTTALLVAIIAWMTWYTVVKFSNPALTETQVFLQTTHGLIPVVILALLLALVEYLAIRRRK